MRFLICFGLLFFFHISTSQELQNQAILLDKSLTDNANAVVRLDEMKIDIVAADKMIISVKQVATVLNKDGDIFATNRVFFDNERKIKSLDVYVYDKLGKEMDHIKKKDFKDLSAADGFSLYTDDRVLVKRYVPTSYPYTISLSYEIETSDTAFFPSWYFLSNYKVSVEKSYYSIVYANPLLKPEIKEFNLDKVSITKKEAEGEIVYEAEKISAIKSESLAPSFRKIAPRLKVRLQNFNLKGEEAHVNDWKDMGIWMNKSLLKDRSNLEQGTIEEANNLVEGVTDDLEKAKIIYKYVQENTRYISVQIGIGGWKPISAIDVNRVKYGDCKGLSNYTYALLKAVGVQAYYTVIHAGNDKVDFEEDFAVLQGNHAILAIPYKSSYYWIDCTSQVNPFGFVGDFTDDRKALVIKPGGGEIIKTISYINEENHQYTKGEYVLSSEGNILGNINISTKGIQYNNHFRLEDNTEDDVIDYYKNYWDNINNLKVGDYSFENDRDQIVFSEKIQITAENFASLTGQRILFTVNAFNNNDYIPNRYRNRKLPFEINRGYLDEDEYIVQLPEDYILEAIPSKKTIESDFGVYLITFEYDAGTNNIIYKRKLLLKKGLYSKDKYDEYRNFRKEIARSDNSQVVLLKK